MKDDEDTETEKTGLEQMEDLLDGIGGQGQDDPGANQDDPKDGGAGEQDQDDPGQGQDDKGGDDDAATRQQRTNAAFAQMRTENATLRNRLNKTFEILGIDPDADDVEAQVISKLAETRKMDPKVLQELEDLRANSNELMQQRHQENLKAQLIELQGFGLTDEELVQFMGQLDAAGLNVMTNTQVNLVSEFMNRNSKMLIDKMVAQQVAAALGKESEDKAGDHASTPPGKGGGKGGNADRKITSVADMNAFLDEVVTTK